MIRKFLKDETAATMIEYGLIAAGIAVVCIAGVNWIGTNLLTMFNNIAAELV